MDFVKNFRFSRLTSLVSGLLISCKTVKYEGLRRPRRLDAFQTGPPFLLLDQEDKRRLWSQGGVLMIREMIFLSPCKLFSKFGWPIFCLWYSRLSLKGIFYKTGISVKGTYSCSFPFSDPFIWLFIRRTLSARALKVFLLENVDCMHDAPTSVNRVLMLLWLFFFVLVKQFWTCMVRRSFYTWMIIRYLMTS